MPMARTHRKNCKFALFKASSWEACQCKTDGSYLKHSLSTVLASMALATRGLHSFLAESAGSNVSTNVATRGSATFGQKPFVGHSGRGGTAAFPSAQPRNRFNAALVSASAVLERPAAQQRLHVEPAFEVGLATCCILVSPHAQQEHPACRSGSSPWPSRAFFSPGL